MTKWIYALGIQFYYLTILVCKYLGNQRSKRWIDKRKTLWEDLDFLLANNQSPLVWVHVSSRGETEQALPVIEEIKKQHPKYKVLLTIFSPSAERQLDEVDYIAYLPLDTKQNAEKFVKKINPKMVIWVKYDFWFFHLEAIHHAQIPLIIICAIFRKNQIFFNQLLGKIHRQMLGFFNLIHVQNKQSRLLLESIHLKNIVVSGDTRFDRVFQISKKIKNDFRPKIVLRDFVGTTLKTIVCGSTRPEDYPILSKVHKACTEMAYIIVPHNVNSKSIKHAKAYFPEAIIYSNIQNQQSTVVKAQVIIIDKMGLLMHLYKQAYMCYVGGGFSSSGVHNVLEPAIFGKPIIIGPQFKKYTEVVAMTTTKACMPTNNSSQIIDIIKMYIKNPTYYDTMSITIKRFMEKHLHATDTIINTIHEKAWL